MKNTILIAYFLFIIALIYLIFKLFELDFEYFTTVWVGVYALHGILAVFHRKIVSLVVFGTYLPVLIAIIALVCVGFIDGLVPEVSLTLYAVIIAIGYIAYRMIKRFIP